MNRRVLVPLALLVATSALAIPSGHKWFVVPQSYVVFNHTGVNNIPTGFSTNVLPAVQTSFARWTSANVSCTSWTSTYGGTFTSPTGLAAINQNDFVNRVIWLGGSNWQYDAMTLGLTITSYDPSNGEIGDADMQLNDNIPWQLCNTSCSASNFDLQSVVTHEAGHWLGLDHTSSTQAVMTPALVQGTIHRNLDQLDINDVCTVYPSTGTTGIQGSACTANSNCTSGLACFSASSTGSKICSKTCSTDTDCPTGYTCQNGLTATGTAAKACLVPSGSPDLCKFCTDGTQCGTGICLTDGRHNWCSTSCQPSNSNCGSGYSCQSAGSTAYCAPTGGVCPTAQCSSPSNCAVGYGCTSGMCTATGAVGDRCEVSNYCTSCAVCIGDANEAYCRNCCGGAGQGGMCTSCTNTACGSTASCANLVNSSGQPIADAVCIPAGASSCAACSVDTDCQSGLRCSGGRCHATCTSGAANTCPQQACASNGVCACADEIAYAGQPCTGKVCANGTVCSGSPATCRNTCSSSSPCSTGETCQNNLCVPSNTAGDLCSACANGVCQSGFTCFNNRCYQACDPNSSSSCNGCVSTGASGVCSCSDEFQGPGGACGLVANTPLSCAPGSVCLDGTCLLACTNGTCPSGYQCQNSAQGKVCASTLAGGNTGGGGGRNTNGLPDGGNGPIDSAAGCGCTAAMGPFGFMILSLLLLACRPARRRY